MALSLEQALLVIGACHRRAAEIGIKVTAAVVDEGGLLLALGRMDGAMPLSSEIAEAKAVGSALLLRDGDQIVDLQSQRPAFFQQVDRMVRLPMIPSLGSIVIRSQGQALGALGVSGGLPDQDKDCAQAGLTVLR